MDDLPNYEGIVRSEDSRPIGPAGHCTYCHERISGMHKEDCVCWVKRVKLRMVAEYEVDVPRSWGKSDIEFHRNEGSWCADNGIEELDKAASKAGCGCQIIEYEYLGDA